MEYECPACGGSLTFDSKSQKIKCPFCDSEYEISQFEENDGMNWEVRPGSQWDEGEESSMEVYSCNSCGGEIVCEDTTVSTSCPYCGNPVVLKGKLSGMLKPDYVIPFKLDKNAAKAALRRHVSSKKLVPALFKDENHIDEIKGVYIPFWLFNANVSANMNYRGERIRSWSDSKHNYVEHSYYDIYREGNVIFDNIPVDGSLKMPNDLMESIEPFDFSEAVEFKKSYLAGYMADKYDIDAKDSIDISNNRVKTSTEDIFRDTVGGYSSVIPQSSVVNLQHGSAQYALYPVWLLNTTWQGNTYTFAMNGQTGKFIGDLPMDKKAYWKKFRMMAGIFAVIGTVLAAVIDYMFV